jgi:hypothetical protein
MYLLKLSHKLLLIKTKLALYNVSIFIVFSIHIDMFDDNSYMRDVHQFNGFLLVSMRCKSQVTLKRCNLTVIAIHL